MWNDGPILIYFPQLCLRLTLQVSGSPLTCPAPAPRTTGVHLPSLPGPAQLCTLGEGGRRGPLARRGKRDQKGYYIIAMPYLAGLES